MLYVLLILLYVLLILSYVLIILLYVLKMKDMKAQSLGINVSFCTFYLIFRILGGINGDIFSTVGPCLGDLRVKKYLKIHKNKHEYAIETTCFAMLLKLHFGIGVYL